MPSINYARYTQRVIQTVKSRMSTVSDKVHRLDPPHYKDLLSVSASYCIPQCVRLIAGVCTHYVVYNISKKKNTVDKSKIKDKRKVKPKDKSWVKIGWRTKNRKGWCVQKR